MRIYPVNQNTNLSFKRQLSKAEETELQKITTQAKQILGNTGNSVLIIHDACLPQSSNKNTGVANILSNDSMNFFNFAKTYWGINTVQVLPQGEYTRHSRNGMVCAYTYSALGLNDSLISAETLTQPKWKNLLSEKDFNEIVKENDKHDKSTMVNYENINKENSVFQKMLRKAFARFIALDENEPLKKEFSQFKEDNNDWLKPKSLYAILKKQNNGKEFYAWDDEFDKNLFEINENFSEEKQAKRIFEIINSDPSEVEFFNFKQFLAEKHLQEGRENLHKQGLKLFGDVPINFSEDEKWANPSAFKKDYFIGSNDWQAACLDYHHITDEASPAAILLKRKVALAARRYDGLRIDAGWMYINPRMINRHTEKIERLELQDTVLNMLEKEIAKVKGSDFIAQDISYELKAGPHEFSMFENSSLRPEVAKRVAILESEYLNPNWGFNDHYKNVAGFKPEGYILGVGDHTAQPLSQIALNIADNVESSKLKTTTPFYRREGQINVLSDIFGDSIDELSKPANFIRAKFADIMSAKHNFIFFMDSLGKTARFDAQGLNSGDNYRYKIVENYNDVYHKNIQQGLGLNLPDALTKAFEKANLTQKHANLYKKLQEYAKILKEKDVPKVISETSEISNGKFGYITCILACVGGALLLGSALFNKPKQEQF